MTTHFLVQELGPGRSFTNGDGRVVKLNPRAPVKFDSIDPGVDYYARAEWFEGCLKEVELAAMYPPMFSRPIKLDPVLHAVIEVPVIVTTPGTKFGRARKSDVADTLFAAGSISRLYASFDKVTVAEWKGQLGKTECHARTWALLTNEERRVIERVRTKEERGHIMDAVGIGLVHLWRRAR